MKAKVDTSSSCAATPSCAEGEAAALVLRVGDELCTVAEGGALIDTVEHGLNVSESVAVDDARTVATVADGDSEPLPHTVTVEEPLGDDEALTDGVAVPDVRTVAIVADGDSETVLEGVTESDSDPQTELAGERLVRRDTVVEPDTDRDSDPLELCA